ncbi:MAG: YbaB/EbfC family nucleoid-associated protein [bacterium]|nr:YbaB/EbfC family nucleoid-associated protein [bacterium]
MNLFQQAGDVMKLRKQAAQIQKELANQVTTIEENGIKVVVTGEQKIKEFAVEGIVSQDAINVLNKALKQSQETAAKKMQGMTGELSELLGSLKK